MNKNIIVAVVLGLIIGVVGTLGVTAIVTEDKANQTNIAATDHSTMSMADMTEELKNKSGDDYDKAFIEMMIAHHLGAIDMAELSESRAKHDEIKKLSKDIIEAQTSEISEMQQWQTSWGYTNAPTSHNMH